MERRRKLTKEEVERAVALIEDGRSHHHVAAALGRSQSVVTRAYNRWLHTGLKTRRPGQGRPRITSEREDRAIQRTSMQDRQISRAELARRFQRPISAHTIGNRLREVGIKACRPKKAPALLDRHKRARRIFARGHLRWTREDWRRVMFSDETRIFLRGNDGRTRVNRRRGERYLQENMVNQVAFGAGSVMFWAGIMYNERTPLVPIPPPALTAARYRDEILLPHVVPKAQQMENFIFMQDNARSHVAQICLPK